MQRYWMQASPVACAPIARNAAAMSKPRASEECAMWTCAPVSSADLEDLEIGHRLGQRRARARVPDRRPCARRACASAVRLLDEFLILVVDRDRQPGPGDLAECGDHRRMVDARKTDRVVFVGRDLERADRRPPPVPQSRRRRHACAIVPYSAMSTCAVRSTQPTFSASTAADGHRLRHVVGHVDAGGDAAGSRTARGALDPGPADRAARVHVAIDEARQDQAAAVIDDLAGGRRRALADGGDRLAAQCDVGAGENFGRGDDVAEEHAVERSWQSRVLRGPRLPSRQRDTTKTRHER